MQGGPRAGCHRPPQIKLKLDGAKLKPKVIQFNVFLE